MRSLLPLVIVLPLLFPSYSHAQDSARCIIDKMKNCFGLRKNKKLTSVFDGAPNSHVVENTNKSPEKVTSAQPDPRVETASKIVDVRDFEKHPLTGGWSADYARAISDTDIHTVKTYVQAIADGSTHDTRPFINAYSLLTKIDDVRGTHYSVGLAGPSFSHMIELKDPSLSWLYWNSVSRFKQGKLEAFDAVLNVIRSNFKLGKIDELKRSFTSIFAPEAPDGKSSILREIFPELAKNKRKYSEDAEILFQAYLSTMLKYAHDQDGYLSKGMGFHHAHGVNGAAMKAMNAIDAFEKAGFERSSLTSHMDLPRLKQLFSALTYDSQGRRKLGDSITPEQAFGGNRTSSFDPYLAIEAVLARSSAEKLASPPLRLPSTH
jgi:hypothetical protein